MTKLGVVAGGGELPIAIAKAYAKPSEVYVVALKNYADIESFTGFNTSEFNIGNIGKILKYFESNGVKNLVIAGIVKRPNLSDLSVDMKGAILLSKIIATKFLGDDALLKIMANYIESHGFAIKSPLEYMKSNDSIKTKRTPNRQNYSDIEYGILAAKKLGELDIGQAVIIENGLVLGVEAAEGTDELIARSSNYRKTENTAVLVKMIKPKQDERLDVPVIGVDTVTNAASAKMAGIAVQKDKVIIIDPETVVEAADRAKIFVHLF